MLEQQFAFVNIMCTAGKNDDQASGTTTENTAECTRKVTKHTRTIVALTHIAVVAGPTFPGTDDCLQVRGCLEAAVLPRLIASAPCTNRAMHDVFVLYGISFQLVQHQFPLQQNVFCVIQHQFLVQYSIILHAHMHGCCVTTTTWRHP